jgi:hypothetical protein
MSSETRLNKMEVAMERTSKARTAKALLRFAMVVVAAVGLRTIQVSGVVLDTGLRPSPALRNYQHRIRATQTLLESERLVLDGT